MKTDCMANDDDALRTDRKASSESSEPQGISPSTGICHIRNGNQTDDLLATEPDRQICLKGSDVHVAVKSEDWRNSEGLQICLCQPEPKIRRPRNAFILYRQHHQASVKAQNPGVANPDISKVIGDHWRSSTPDTKAYWQNLAEKEKVRHREEHPTYRYQPRRSIRGSNHSIADVSVLGRSADVKGHCLKCGGRSLSSAAMTSTSVPVSDCSPARSTYRCGPYGRDTYHNSMPPPSKATAMPSPHYSRGMISPHGTDNVPSIQRFQGPPSIHPVPVLSPLYQRISHGNIEDMPHSPDSKRRRVTGTTFTPVGRDNNDAPTPTPFTTPQRRPSLPRPELMGSTMVSPLDAGTMRQTAEIQRRTESLKLAPFQPGAHVDAHMNNMTAPGEILKLNDGSTQSIPVLNKIRVLSRISPPLPTKSVSNAENSCKQFGQRGLIIAIDSSHPSAVKQLKLTLLRSMHTEFDLQVFELPVALQKHGPRNFQGYLQLLDAYHTLNNEILNHVTDTARISDTAKSGIESRSQSISSPVATIAFTSSEQVSPKTIPINSFVASRVDVSAHSSATVLQQSGDEEPTPNVKNKLPVALLPSWQLTNTDSFATSVPVTGNYSPTDHWQWAATVWRGIVGADITVATESEKRSIGEASCIEQTSMPAGIDGIQSQRGEADAIAVTKEASKNNPRKGTPYHSTAGTSGSGNGLGSSNPGVEVRFDDARAVIVKIDKVGHIADGALRRVGFEVGEWARARLDELL